MATISRNKRENKLLFDIGGFAGIKVKVDPNLVQTVDTRRVRCTWWERLYQRPLWPFGSVEWKKIPEPKEVAFTIDIGGTGKRLLMNQFAFEKFMTEAEVA